jgi:ankyrin repeat protein
MRVLDSINYSGKDVLEGVKRIVNQADSKNEYNEALIWTSRHGYLEATKYLVGIGADVNARNDEAIKHSSRKGCLETTKYLVSQGANVRTGNNSPVRAASEYNHPQTVRFLVEQGADIRDSNGPESLNAIQWVFFFGHVELLEYFIEEQGISVNSYNNYSLRCAIAHGRADIVRLLIQRFGADVDEKALELAVENNYPELAEYLRNIIKTNSNKS